MPRNNRLFEVTRDLVSSLLGAAYGHYSEHTQHLFSASHPHWVRIDDHFFERREEEEPSLQQVLFELIPLTADLPERTAFDEELRRDDAIAPQLGGVPAGATGLGAAALGSAEIADRMTSEVFAKKPMFDLDDASFEEVYEDFESSLYETEIASTLLVPLTGLSVQHPGPIGDGAALTDLSDAEIDICIRTGLIRPISPSDRIAVRSCGALRIEDTHTKLTGSDYMQEAIQNPRDLLIEALTKAQWLVSLLNLLKQGRVSVAGVVGFSHTWILRNSHSTMVRMPSQAGDPTFVVDEPGMAELLVIIDQVTEQRVKRHKAITLAIRRFNLAGERSLPEDVVLDLAIAAEALFLSDNDKQELSYRFALRAAYFLGSTPEERERIQKHMKRAYEVRSKIAHGSQVATAQLADGSQVALSEHAEVTQEYLRAVIRKLLDTAPASGPMVDWDRLILGFTE